ncbi:hypothetical protein [Geodermatophilus amargosae]|uniref:hypothetical protein n=1 Tax=Geodermatophilus amargosae TaxID=1296565 RepID=UPI0034E02C57
MAAAADVAVDAVGDRATAAERRPVVTLRVDRNALVPALATLLIVLHLVLRSWTAAGGWFTDLDFQATAAALGVSDEVTGPPGAVALSRALAAVAPLSWPAAVGLALVGQLVVDVALYRLLVALFGHRPAVLLPLAVYLASTLPLVGGVWWSAAVVQLPVQLALLAATAAHVRYLRDGRPGAAVGAALAVAVGTLFSVGLLLVPLLLAVLTLLWWTEGPLRARLAGLVRHRSAWLLQLGAVAVGAGTRALTDRVPVDAAGLADGVRALPGTLSDTVLPGLTGGPWTWSPVAPTLAAPDPRAGVVAAAAVVVGVVALVTVVVTRGALRALLLAATAVVVGVVTAAADPGAGDLPAGLVAPAAAALVVALCLGLAWLPVVGAPVVPRRRAWAQRGSGTRLVSGLLRPALGAVAVALLAAASLSSTTAFAGYWHDNHARSFVETAAAELAERPGVVLVDGPLPETVVPAALQPAVPASTVLAGLVDQPRWLPDGEVVYELATLDGEGRVQLAAVDPVAGSGAGPVPDCGWTAGPEPADVPLEDAAPDGRWIVQVSYLGGSDNAVFITAGGARAGALVGPGLHDLFLQVTGPVDAVRVEVQDTGRPLCVGAVRVGTTRPLAGR